MNFSLDCPCDFGYGFCCEFGDGFFMAVCLLKFVMEFAQELAQKFVPLSGNMRRTRSGGWLRSKKKHIKIKTRKQNFHGIVPGFWGGILFKCFSPP